MTRSSFRDLFSIDIRSLALFRVGLALLLLCDLVDRSKDLTAHYTDAGVLPRAALAEYTADTILSLHLLGGSLAFEGLLFLLSGILAVMLLIGWHTRLATGLSFVLLFSLQQRNLLITHNGDVLERFLLLWGFFLPLGAYAAFDARRRQPAPQSTHVFSVASVALLFQPLAIYVVATVSKLQSDAWLEGRALYAVLNKASYVRPLGEWLLEFPEAVTFFNYGTIVIEGLIPLMLLSPWGSNRLRTGAVVANFVFQCGIWLCLNIGYFQPLAALSVIPFIPSSVWDRSFRFRLPVTGAGGDAGQAPRPGRVWHHAGSAVAGLLLAYVIASNVTALFPSYLKLPKPLYSAGRILSLNQRWRVFANTDGTVQGWFVVIGHLQDGRAVDLTQGRPTVSFERPQYYAETLPNNNWRIYWSKMAQPKFAVWRPYLADYFCSQWDTTENARASLVSVEVIHMAEIAYDPKEPKRIIPRRLIYKPCVPLLTSR
jgi:hypothetical protein